MMKFCGNRSFRRGRIETVFRYASVLCLLVGNVSCSDLSGLLKDNALPDGISNPALYDSPDGAIAMANAAICAFQGCAWSTGQPLGVSRLGGFLRSVLESGLISDELQPGLLGGEAYQYGSANETGNFDLDALNLPESYSESEQGSVKSETYGMLQTVRALSAQARGALAVYPSTGSDTLRALLFSLEGYSVVILADLYCSGVPLSQVTYKGDFVLGESKRTSQLYEYAISLFDSSLVLSEVGSPINSLARVGRGRSLLHLGRYKESVESVIDVFPNFIYKIGVDWSLNDDGVEINSVGIFRYNSVTTSDNEGLNGLPYLADDDPRTRSIQNGSANKFGVVQRFPEKYADSSTLPPSPTGRSAISLASGMEAQLILAEYALWNQDFSEWLRILNTLRRDSFGLDPLMDPGTPEARIRLHFKERAFFLYLSGQRLGDMRRMIRQYGFLRERVFPVGSYPSLLPVYGIHVNLPIPATEYRNPHFTGCLDREA